MKNILLIACLLTASVVVAQDVVRFKGVELRPLSADTTAIKDRLGDGGLIYNGTTDKLRVKVNGTWVNVVTGSAGAAITASNGLTKIGANIEFGGILTGATVV